MSKGLSGAIDETIDGERSGYRVIISMCVCVCALRRWGIGKGDYKGIE